MEKSCIFYKYMWFIQIFLSLHSCGGTILQGLQNLIVKFLLLQWILPSAKSSAKSFNGSVLKDFAQCKIHCKSKKFTIRFCNPCKIVPPQECWLVFFGGHALTAWTQRNNFWWANPGKNEFAYFLNCRGKVRQDRVCASLNHVLTVQEPWTSKK